MPLIGNKVIERDLRDWLEQNGYFGRTANIEELELVAIRRPGWEQVFRFRAKAKSQSDADWHQLRGLIRDDERHRTDIQLTASEADFDALFASWTADMITLGRRERGVTETALILLALVILGVAFGVALFKGA